MRDHLIVASASLQLIPKNATKWARFERLLELASSLRPEDVPKRMPKNLLRKLLTSSPIATPQIISGEVPFEEPFVTVITFFGGSYRVVSGGASAASVGCQLLLDASRLLPDDDESTEFRERLFLDAEIALKLSDAVCERAGLGRWMSPSLSPKSEVVIPASSEFDRLGKAVTFSPDDLGRVLGTAAEFVDVLMASGRLDLVDHDQKGPTDDRIYLYPLVRTSSGDVIVALPSGLAGSIMHRGLARAVELGIEERVVNSLHRATQMSLRRAFARVRWSRVQGPKTLDKPANFQETFYRFDLDKVAHVVTVIDRLDDYVPGEPFGHADFSSVQTELHQRFPEIRSAVRSQSPEVSVLHVVCSAPLGRSHFMGFEDTSSDDTSALLAASLDDIDLIARLEKSDRLALWKFALASKELHRRSRVLSFSTFDEYAIYRDHGHSYYTSDDRHPTFVSVQPGSGGDLRVNERQRIDLHAVPLPEGGNVVEVTRWAADDATPVYQPDMPEFHPYHRVELQVPCWVIPSPEVAEEERLSEKFAEAIAFWLWRCESLVGSALDRLSGRWEKLIATVRVTEQRHDPSGDSELHPVAEWLQVELRPSEGRVDFLIAETARYRLARPDNEAEREIAIALVEAIHDLAGERPTGLRAQVKQAIPIGEMRMIQVLDERDDALLTLGEIAEPRLLPDADVELLLDSLGEFASSDLGLAQGPIPSTGRTQVLNSIVEELSDQLMSELSGIEPDGLLEYLTGEREALLFLEARGRLTLPSLVACFGEQSSGAREAVESAQALVSTSVANRYLLEAATARPPAGERQMTLSVYDHLLALANQIIQYGFMSDAIRHELSSVELSILPSGRLGSSREEPYLEALAAFRDMTKSRAVSHARERYAAHWGERDEEPIDFDPTEVDEAYHQEFGISATDLAHLTGDLVELARSERYQVATRALDDLGSELCKSLGWSRDRVRSGLQLLSLDEVAEFPRVANRADVYPWRYGRNRSAARRPLCVRSNPAGDLEAVWGARGTYRSAGYLVDQVRSGRLNAKSRAMKRYITSVRQAGNDAFRGDVAEFFRGLGYSDVREDVKKFGQFRLRRPNGEDLGDVDVLVIDRARKVLLATEVKDFEFARTPAELSHELDKLLDGPRSAAHHHGERLDAIKRDLPRLLEGLDASDSDEDWEVRGLIVTSADLITSRFPKAQRLSHGLTVTPYELLQNKGQGELTGSASKSTATKKRKGRRRR
ncbi:MAG: hypothetical protein WEE36_09245 [Acidimicrobiia bacterium]